jgi:signal transduction histidine kinase
MSWLKLVAQIGVVFCMLIPTSSEFVALCRAQVALLTQGLGASLSVVYLTQELVEGVEMQLVPIVAYPETAADWRQQHTVVFPPAAIAQTQPSLFLLTDATDTLTNKTQPPTNSNQRSLSSEDQTEYTVFPDANAALVTQRQLVLPLLHDAVVLGLLVVERDDRAWNEWEQSQLHHVADTLAIACVLDQRYQWLEHDRQQQQTIQVRQQDMLDNLLHQFRNSLTALQTFGKLIVKRLLPNDPNREIANSIVREVHRLHDLSEQFETITQVEHRPVPRSLLPASEDSHSTMPLLPESIGLSETALFLEPCSVSEVLAPLLASASAIAQDKNLTVDADIPSDLPPVWANSPALREVLNNLIENALKYTPAGGQLTVQATQQSVDPTTAQVEIAVSNTGSGIPPQDLPHLFERHYRGVQAQSGIPGSGLGLAIAKTLTEQMHGEIQVFSPARTRNQDHSPKMTVPTQEAGTTFVLKLAIAGTNNRI